MLMNNLAMKFYLSLLRNADGVDGGGAGGDGGLAGAAPAGGEGAAPAAGDAAPSPSLLSRAAPVDPNAPPAPVDPNAPAGETKEPDAAPEPPAAFDITGLTLPEGFELDADAGKAFADILGNDKLTPQERGQALADLHAQTVQQVTQAVTEQLQAQGMEQFLKMNADWEKQTAALPEFKANPDAEVGKIFQVLTTLGAGEEFFKAVDMTGAGNHPAIMQVLHRLVQRFLEGGPVGGDGKPVAGKQLGANIYKSANP